mmetsp:Transcript_1353/g.2851  ORF Transcript_1353/g.2851 Transcript_1353/m.2851 type:complete len:87 (+) Transcript_1353:2000-2260(+)
MTAAVRASIITSSSLETRGNKWNRPTSLDLSRVSLEFKSCLLFDRNRKLFFHFRVSIELIKSLSYLAKLEFLPTKIISTLYFDNTI